MRASSSSMRRARARALAGVAGGAVAPGQLVELVEQGAGVADVAAHGAVGPAQPVGVEPQVQLDQLGDHLDVVVRVAQGLHPVAGHAGPDHLVVVERHAAVGRRTRVLGLPTSWNRAASRSSRSGPVLSTTAMVWASTSLWRWIGSCSRARPGSSGRNSSASPVSTRNHSAADGTGDHQSLSSSSRIRSADTIASRSCVGAHRVDQRRVGRQVVAGDEAGRPQHPQRVVGEGHLGGERRAQPAGGQVGRARRTGRSAPARAGARAMALTVKSRRDRSASMAVGELDVGLAGVGVVGLGPVGGDLVDLRRRVGSRWCRTACPGSRPRRPSRRPAPRCRRAGRRW